jgi:hypothetical protein
MNRIIFSLLSLLLVHTNHLISMFDAFAQETVTSPHWYICIDTILNETGLMRPGLKSYHFFVSEILQKKNPTLYTEVIDIVRTQQQVPLDTLKQTLIKNFHTNESTWYQVLYDLQKKQEEFIMSTHTAALKKYHDIPLSFTIGAITYAAVPWIIAGLASFMKCNQNGYF